MVYIHVCFHPPPFPQVYIEDSLGERIWVDSSHCKTFVDNIQTAFNTKMPPKTMLLQAETGRSGGDLSAGTVYCGMYSICKRVGSNKRLPVQFLFI